MTDNLLPYGVFLLFTLPVTLYHFFVFSHTEPWSLMYQMMSAFNPISSFGGYLLALGPLFPLSLLSILSIREDPRPIYIFLLVWLLLPLFLYPFCGSLIPINTSRLFQTNQYIPMCILAVVGLSSVFSFKLPRLLKSLKLLIVLFLLFSSIPYYLSIVRNNSFINPNAYNVYAPRSLVGAFEFLDRNTPDRSVVLSGEYVGSMIPAFTHDRTILGRNDNARDYYQKQKQAFDFLNGKMAQEEAKMFLQKYKISYLLLGMDTLKFSVLPYGKYPFLSVVYEKDPVSVVRVDWY